MATRKLPAAADLPGDAAAGPHGDSLDEVVTVLARGFAGLAAYVSGLQSRGSASGEQILVQELRILSHAEFGVLKAWLASHPGGG